MSIRVTQVARLLAKKTANYPSKVCTKMVKRKTTEVISVGSASLNATTGDTLKRKSPKADQAWRYPGGVIRRHADRVINTKTYTDDKDPEQNRRRQESNFFITLNTNRHLQMGGQIAQEGKDACRHALDLLAKDNAICQYLKFGPKSDHYKDDRYEDVIEKVEFNGAVETGEQQERLHCHIWLTVHHYSQVQINMPVMQHMFKSFYNGYIEQKSYHKAELGIKPRSKAYIQVKLLPTSDWAQVMRQYIHKAMGGQTDPSVPDAQTV